ncbi:hypothetical protein CHS0354_005237 [Potamilus streckersoni]|uniref:Uncharacterized protein n=1 Tax=Potamilus streckersoni TaxID=2493646 RepID=A0AAE0VPQ1_9BIVA|nr:hypothetical protein CHS0354_005237 [Potamilus streckersoni]
MAALYSPVIVCVIFVIGTVAQQEGHTGHTVHGVHGGHGGKVIRQKLTDTGDASIARATDPFGVSQGRRASSHSSHAIHGEHGAHGAQTGHGSHAIIGGSHGVQGHGSHGSNSKARQSNHGIQKSDNKEHHQTSTHQDTGHGQSSTFEQTGHGLDSGRHLDHKTVLQEVTKSHTTVVQEVMKLPDRPVPKVQDGHSIIEINALSSHSGHSIPALTAITEIGSHATHGEHGARGVQTEHGGHAIIGGSHGIQGHGIHGIDSKVGHDNHDIQKLDHTEHHQTSTHQGSENGQGIKFEQIGHGIDIGRPSDHKTVVQEVTKSHDLPVHKDQDGQSTSEINAVSSHAGHNIPTHTSIIIHDTTNNLKSDHEIPVHGSVKKHNINAENMHHGHALSSQGTQETHESHVNDMHVGHNIPSLMNQQDINMHSGHDMKNKATKDMHNAHSFHDSHALSSHNSPPQNNDAGNDRHTMPSHEAIASNIDHNAHSGNVKPSIENKNNLPGLNAHEIHAGHIMTTQSGSANPSRHSMIERSETMAPPEHKIHVSPSHDVHEVPTIIENISTKEIEHGGHFTPVQDKPDNVVILGTSKEIHHGVHTPDANIQRISGTPSQSFTQLPDKRFVQSLSNVNNQWHHSNIRHISPKPQVPDVHIGHENFNMKNPQKPSDGIRSGPNEKLAENSDHRMNRHLPIVMLTSNSVDQSAKDSTVNQNNGGHTMKNDTKPNFVDVVGTRQSNNQPPLDWVTQRGHEIHKAQQQLRKENIHTVTGLIEGLNSKKEALSNVGLIGHIDQGEKELHDHPVDASASSSNPDGIITADPNLNVDRSRIHTDTDSNVPNVNKGTGPQTSNVHTTSQTSRVTNSAGSSLNLNNFLENINAQLNSKGFGFTEPSMSNSGVSNSLGQQSRGAIMRQDNHNISSHTGSSFDAGAVSNWGQGNRDTFTGFQHNSGMRDRNNRHQLPPTTPSPPTESTTVFVQQFSGEPTSMDSLFMRMFDPLTADMMFNRNVYPPVVDPFNDPRVPHNHGPMPSPAQNNGISLFDLFAGEF